MIPVRKCISSMFKVIKITFYELLFSPNMRAFVRAENVIDFI